MNKINVYLDFDSTLVQSIEAIVSMVNVDRGTNYNHIKVNQWNFSNVFDITNEEVAKYFEDDRFFDKVKLFPDVVRVLEKYSDRCNYTVVTKGSLENLNKKKKWLNKNLPMIKYFYGLEYNNSMDKSSVDMNQPFSIHIDDVDECLFTSNANHKILFTEPERGICSWNKDWHGCFAKDWNEVDEMIQEILKMKGID